MNQEENQTDTNYIRGYIKSGLLTLSALVLIILGFQYLPDAVYTMKQGSGPKLPIYCVECESPKVALSFDTAWGNEDTSDLLEIMDEYDIKATFFMTGGWVETYPEDVKAIADAGHDLGNHSTHHQQMSLLSKKECISEIKTLHNSVKKLTGVEMNLFRPPYGDYNDTLMEAIEDSGYYGILWDVDSLDWKNYGVDSIITTVVENPSLSNGSIILLHNGANYTKDALPKIIEGLTKKGYEIVPVSELILNKDYHIDYEGRQCAN